MTGINGIAYNIYHEFFKEWIMDEAVTDTWIIY